MIDFLSLFDLLSAIGALQIKRMLEEYVESKDSFLDCYDARQILFW